LKCGKLNNTVGPKKRGAAKWRQHNLAALSPCSMLQEFLMTLNGRSIRAALDKVALLHTTLVSAGFELAARLNFHFALPAI